MSWRVETETGSVYLVDTEAMTLTRQEATHGLRRDGEALAILMDAVPEPIVGQPMRFLVDVRQDGVSTWRTTSPVTKVERFW